MAAQRVTPRLLQQVKELAAQGSFTWEIMTITGLSESTVYKIRQGRYDEHGVQARFCYSENTAAPTTSPQPATGVDSNPEEANAITNGDEPDTNITNEISPGHQEQAAVIGWCPSCRCHIFPPCQLCRAKSHRLKVHHGRARQRPAVQQSGQGSDRLRTRLQLNVAELGLPLRTVNFLQFSGIATVQDLLYCKPQELLRIPNFGTKSLRQIFQALERLGFRRNASNACSADE